MYCNFIIYVLQDVFVVYLLNFCYRNCMGITRVIIDLLVMDLKMNVESEICNSPLNLIKPQHPLISVIIQNNSTWMDMLTCIKSIYISHVEYVKYFFIKH